MKNAKLEISEMITAVRALRVNQVDPMAQAYVDKTSVQAYKIKYSNQFGGCHDTAVVVTWSNGADCYYSMFEEQALRLVNLMQKHGVIRGMNIFSGVDKED